MPSNLKLSTAARNAAVNAVTSLVDSSGIGQLQIYDDGEGAGIPPVNDSLTSQNLLASFPLATPAFNAAASGGASLKAVPTESTSDGIAAFFRFLTGSGQAVMQGTVGDSGDAPVDLQLNTKSLVLGGTLSVSGFTVTMPS